LSNSINITKQNTLLIIIKKLSGNFASWFKKFLILNIMASPINITPSLKGESSAYFNKQLKEQEQNKITIAEKERMLQMMKQILKKSTEKK
jgi:hypothetical protein